MITYKDLTEAVQKLKEKGVPDELFYAGVCPDGVYRVIPAEEYASWLVREQKIAQQKEKAAHS